MQKEAKFLGKENLRVSKDQLSIYKTIPNENLFDIEKQRSIEAYQQSIKSGKFITPKIISVENSTICFEYFSKANLFSEIMKRDLEEALSLVPAIVDCIQWIEKKLKHSKVLQLDSPFFSEFKNDNFVHGDFTISNLLFKNQHPILIDWSSSRVLNSQFNFAPKSWDLVWFVSGIFTTTSIRSIKSIYKIELANKILDNYISRGGDLKYISKLGQTLNQYYYNEYFLKRFRWHQIIRYKHMFLVRADFWKNLSV